VVYSLEFYGWTMASAAASVRYTDLSKTERRDVGFAVSSSARLSSR